MPSTLISMKPSSFLLPGLLAVVVLSSCASGIKHRRAFNEAQREALSSISVPQTEFAAGAYESPKGGTKNPKYGEGDGLRQMGIVAGAGGAGGAVGGVVGALIGEAAGSIKERAGVNDATAYYPLVKQTAPVNLDAVYHQKLKTSLKRNRFFSPRIQENGENQITSTIVAYRLKYNGPDAHGGATFIASVAARVELKNVRGKAVAGGVYEGESKTPYKLSAYAKKDGPSQKSYEEAASQSVLSFLGDMSDKTRE